MYKVRNAGEVALDNANTAVQAVLNNSNYSLEEDFGNIFYNELGNEIIFAWSYIQDEYTGGYPGDYLVPSQYVSVEAIENPVTVPNAAHTSMAISATTNTLSGCISGKNFPE